MHGSDRLWRRHCQEYRVASDQLQFGGMQNGKPLSVRSDQYVNSRVLPVNKIDRVFGFNCGNNFVDSFRVFWVYRFRPIRANHRLSRQNVQVRATGKTRSSLAAASETASELIKAL